MKAKKPKKISNLPNFELKCPLELAQVPTSPCDEGKPILDDKNRLGEEGKCPWWISSQSDCYCFWRYVLNHSDGYGEMPECSQQMMAKLLAVSATKIHFDTKDALLSLIEKCKEQQLHVLNENEGTGIHNLLDELEELLDNMNDENEEEV